MRFDEADEQRLRGLAETWRCSEAAAVRRAVEEAAVIEGVLEPYDEATELLRARRRLRILKRLKATAEDRIENEEIAMHIHQVTEKP